MSILLTSKDQEQRFLRIWRTKKKALKEQTKHLKPEEQEQAKSLLMLRIIAKIKADTKAKRLRLKLLNGKLKAKGISTDTGQTINRKDRQEYLKARAEERTAYENAEDITQTNNENGNNKPDRER